MICEEEEDGRSTLRHNTRGRYDDVLIWVKPGTTLFGDGFRLPPETYHGGALSQFPGKVTELKIMVKARYSKQVRGGRCNHAGGHVEEYNFRYCHKHGKDPEEKKDTILAILKYVTESLLSQA